MDGLLGGDLGADAVLLPRFQRHAGACVETHAPNAADAFIPGLCDVQLGCTVGHFAVGLGSIPEDALGAQGHGLGYVLRRLGLTQHGGGADRCQQHRLLGHLLHLHVADGDLVVQRALAHLQFQHQLLAAVSGGGEIGGDGLGLALAQESVPQSGVLPGVAAVGINQLIVKRFVGLHRGGHPVFGAGLRDDAGLDVDAARPHLVLVGLFFDHGGGGTALRLHQGHGKAVVGAGIHAVGAVKGELLQRNGGIVGGHHHILRAQIHAAVHGEVGGQHIGVMLIHLLHPDVVHRHLAAVGRLAEGELQNHLAALGACRSQVDELLEGALGHIAHALAVEGAVALLVIAVVEADLHVHLMGGGHVRADPVQGARLQNGGGLHVQAGHPHLGTERNLLHLHGDAVQMAVQLIEIARVVLHVHRALGAPGDGHGHDALIVGLGLQLLHLDGGEVDGKGLQRAQLQIQIGVAVAGADLAGDAVLTLTDGELVEVTELHRARHVGLEVVGHPVIPAGHGHVVALQLHMPGLAVGLGGGKAIHAVHRLALTGYVTALKLGPEHVGRLVREDQRLGGLLLLRLHHHRGGVLRLVHHSGGLGALAARGQQHGQQQEKCNNPSRAFHVAFLLAKMVVPAEIRRRKRAISDPFSRNCAKWQHISQIVYGGRVHSVNKNCANANKFVINARSELCDIGRLHKTGRADCPPNSAEGRISSGAAIPKALPRLPVTAASPASSPAGRKELWEMPRFLFFYGVQSVILGVQSVILMVSLW